MEEFRYIRAERFAGSIIIRFTDIDLSGDTLAECIRLEVEQLLKYERPDKLIFDFTNVRSISSSVISTLLVIRKRLVERRIPMALCSVPVPILEIYRTLQLEGTQFHVYGTINDALQAPSIIDSEFPPEQMED